MEIPIIQVIVPLVPLFLKPLKAVSKHVIYPFEVSSNTSSLESATRKLRALKSDVETRITNAQQENGMPTEEINLWLEEVETVQQKAANIQQKHEHLRRCLWNTFSNPWSNYKISRSAARKLVEVNSLCDRRASIQEVIVRQVMLLPASSPTAYNDSQAIKKIGPCGGTDGGYKNMTVKGTTRIRWITVLHSYAIHGIQVGYKTDGREEDTGRWGGEGGEFIESTFCIKDEGEYITSVSGRMENCGGFILIKSIKFHTNLTIYGPYGDEKGLPFELSDFNGQIIGFYGRFGYDLNAIGVYVKGL